MSCECTKCEILDLVNIDSSDNSISVEKKDCGYDLKYLPNNLNNILKINSADCISFTTEFINGVLNITPEIDYDCLAEKLCGKCGGNSCSPPMMLTVE